MSDPVTNIEIEDVLSSIRRLVAEGDKPKADASERPEVPDKLVLTPALRVSSERAKEPLKTDLEVDAELVAADWDAGASETNAPERSDRRVADTQSARASLEATIAELEAAVTEQHDEFEPDGSEVRTAPTWASAGFGQVVGEKVAVVDRVQDTAVTPSMLASDALAAIAMPSEAFDEDQDQDQDQDQDEEPTFATSGRPVPFVLTPSDSVPTEKEPKFASRLPRDSIAAAIISARADGTKPGIEKTPGAGSMAPSQPTKPQEPAPATEPTFRHSRVDDDDTDYGDELLGSQADPLAPDEDLDAYLADGAIMDEGALRELVAEVLHQELQGKLGERITRNVRKLVRREIHRVLNSQDID